MRKTIKILAVLGGAVLVLLGAAAVALRVLFPPAKIRALLLARGEKALHRKIEIQDVSLGLLSGLRVLGVRISERPDFSAGEFFKAEALSFRVAWLPLLHRSLVVREIDLRGVDAHLVLGKNGTYNFQDIAGASSAGAGASSQAAGPAALPIALLVDSIRVTGSLTYEDQTARAMTTVSGLDARFRALRLSGPFPIEGKARVRYEAGPSRYQAGVQVQGELDLADLNPAALRGDLSQVRLDVEGIPISGSAKFKGAPRSAVEGRLSLPALTTQSLAALAGKAVPAGLYFPSSRLAFSLAYGEDALALSSVQFRGAGLEANLSGRVARLSSKNPELSLDLSTNRFELKPLAGCLAGAKGLGVGGQARLQARISGPLLSPKVQGSLDLQDLAAAPLAQRLQAFSGTVHFTEDSVEIPSLSGKINGGDLKLKLSARNWKAPVVDVQGSLGVLDAGALLALIPSAPARSPSPPPSRQSPGPILKTSGRFAVGRVAHPNFTASNLAFAWDLSGVSSDLDLLEGKASFRAGEGKATGLLKLLEQKKALRMLLYPLSIVEKARGLKIPGLKLPSVDDLAYARVEGDYVFHRGVMSLEPFLLDGPDLRVETRGAVDLPGEKSDLRVQVQLPQTASVALFVKGPWASPSITPDLSRVVREARRKAEAELKEKLQQKGEELLKGFFK